MHLTSYKKNFEVNEKNDISFDFTIMQIYISTPCSSPTHFIICPLDWSLTISDWTQVKQKHHQLLSIFLNLILIVSLLRNCFFSPFSKLPGLKKKYFSTFEMLKHFHTAFSVESVEILIPALITSQLDYYNAILFASQLEHFRAGRTRLTGDICDIRVL